MPTNGSGPKCPSVKRLREILDGDNCITGSESTEARDAFDALEWLATMLENRALYHKKQNLKKKILINLAQEHGLIDQANALTRDALHDYVSSQEPDND